MTGEHAAGERRAEGPEGTTLAVVKTVGELREVLRPLDDDAPLNAEFEVVMVVDLEAGSTVWMIQGVATREA